MNTVKKINLEAIPSVNEAARANRARANTLGSSKRSGSNFRSPTMAVKHRRHQESRKRKISKTFHPDDFYVLFGIKECGFHVLSQDEYSVQYSDGTTHYWS